MTWEAKKCVPRGVARAGLLACAVTACQAEVDFGPSQGPVVISPALPEAEDAGVGLPDETPRDGGVGLDAALDGAPVDGAVDGAPIDADSGSGSGPGSGPDSGSGSGPGSGSVGSEGGAGNGVDRSDPAWPLSVASALASQPDASAAIGPVPALRVEPGSLYLDGDVGDWSERSWIALEPPQFNGQSELSAQDWSAACALRWTPEALYLAVVVRDDRHSNFETAAELFEGDSVQLTGGSGGGVEAEWHYGWALTGEGAIARSWLPTEQDPSGQMHFSIRRRSGVTTYEIELTTDLLYVESLGSSSTLALNLVVNEADDAAGTSARVQLVGSDSDAGTAPLAQLYWQ